MDIDDSKSSISYAAGLKYYPVKKFFINLEIKYTPLKVSPAGTSVDLGGMNYNMGIGVTF